MNKNIQRISENISGLRSALINHKVYGLINGLEDLHTFMHYHVYAVWDFMSLLKSLQNNLTCTSTPWYPKGSAETRYLINEIVLGEECDTDMHGNRVSHFELYLSAMAQCGANVAEITMFLKALHETNDLDASFIISSTPLAARNFVHNTFDVVNGNKDYLQAAVFTFGREDLIPGMFIALIKDIETRFHGRFDILRYYLTRHIEVDGDHHSKLALEMTASLCGENETYWADAESAVKVSLQRRIELWDAVSDAIVTNKFKQMNSMEAKGY